MRVDKIAVKSRSFNLLLSGLLPKDAPFISVADASTQPQSTYFLDAREDYEYNVSHLAGAIHIGYRQFNIAALQTISTAQKIIVYCSVGWRSGHIAAQLIAAGYTEVYNLYGGIFEWCNAGHDVYRQNTAVQKVHVYSALWKHWLTAPIQTIY